LFTDDGEHKTYDEALKVENSTKCELAMKDGIDSLMTIQTWELIELPAGMSNVHTEEELICPKAISKTMVQEF